MDAAIFGKGWSFPVKPSVAGRLTFTTGDEKIPKPLGGAHRIRKPHDNIKAAVAIDYAADHAST